jgi:excisionase family DNA binding protein
MGIIMDTSKPIPAIPAKLSIQEVATRCGVSRGVIKNQIYSGALRAKKFGRRVLIDEAELDRFYQALPDASIVSSANNQPSQAA